MSVIWGGSQTWEGEKRIDVTVGKLRPWRPGYAWHRQRVRLLNPDRPWMAPGCPLRSHREGRALVREAGRHACRQTEPEPRTWPQWLMSDASVPCCYALCGLTLGYFAVMVGLAALKAGGWPW